MEDVPPHSPGPSGVFCLHFCVVSDPVLDSYFDRIASYVRRLNFVVVVRGEQVLQQLLEGETFHVHLWSPTLPSIMSTVITSAAEV